MKIDKTPRLIFFTVLFTLNISSLCQAEWYESMESPVPVTTFSNNVIAAQVHVVTNASNYNLVTSPQGAVPVSPLFEQPEAPIIQPVVAEKITEPAVAADVDAYEAHGWYAAYLAGLAGAGGREENDGAPAPQYELTHYQFTHGHNEKLDADTTWYYQVTRGADDQLIIPDNGMNPGDESYALVDGVWLDDLGNVVKFEHTSGAWTESHTVMDENYEPVTTVTTHEANPNYSQYLDTHNLVVVNIVVDGHTVGGEWHKKNADGSVGERVNEHWTYDPRTVYNPGDGGGKGEEQPPMYLDKVDGLCPEGYHPYSDEDHPDCCKWDGA